MARIIITIIISLFCFIGNSQIDSISKNEKKFKLFVTMKNIKDTENQIFFALYTKEGFSTKKAITRIQKKALDGTLNIVFNNVPKGDYAILCFQDSNNNHRFDFDIETGRPTENYGVSNNPTLYGPPTFETAKFSVTDKDVTISLSFQ